MNHFLNKKVSIKVQSLLLGVVILLLVVTAAGFSRRFYDSDNPPSLDCMTIHRGYLKQVRKLYSDKSNFESVILPRAIAVGGEINSLCYESIENEGLIR